MKTLLVMGCLLGSGLAVTLEKRDLGGLEVSVESIPEEVIVDGLALRITRASGAGVPQLAQRLQFRWRTEGSAVQSQQVAGWTSVSRLDQGRNELIQWRGEGKGAELLHSSLVTGRLPRSRARAPFALPGACAWGRVIEGVSGGASFEQHTAQCSENTAALFTALQSRLQSLGWNIRSRMDAVWDLHRSGEHARLTLIEGPVQASSSLVWLRVVPGDRR